MQGGDTMFDKKRFRAAQALSGLSTEDIADKLGINVTTLYRKINRDGNFSRNEIQILRSILPMEKPDEIFFANELT